MDDKLSLAFLEDGILPQVDDKLAQEAGKLALLVDDMPAQAFLDDDREFHIQAQDSLEDCSQPEACEGVCILKQEVDILAYLENYNSGELEAGILLLVSLEVGSHSLSQLEGCIL